MTSFQLVEVPGDDREILFLHGTGGSEADLVSLGPDLMPGATVLSPRGKVLEGGMSRWFKRFAEGKFDEESIRNEADVLADFLQTRPVRHRVAVGYSNGANMGAALMQLHPDVLDGLVMWRGMLVFETNPIETALDGKQILMLSGGRGDMMAPFDSVTAMSERFSQSGAEVTLISSDAGHRLTDEDVVETAAWIRTRF